MILQTTLLIGGFTLLSTTLFIALDNAYKKSLKKQRVNSDKDLNKYRR